MGGGAQHIWQQWNRGSTVLTIKEKSYIKCFKLLNDADLDSIIYETKHNRNKLIFFWQKEGCQWDQDKA